MYIFLLMFGKAVSHVFLKYSSCLTAGYATLTTSKLVILKYNKLCL